MYVDDDETKTPEKKQLPLNLKFETTPVEQVSKHRLLGVTVDEQLKWQTHINNTCRTVSRNIFLLSKLSQIVSQKSKLAFFFAHIMSHMNYVSMPRTRIDIFKTSFSFSGSLAWNSLAHHLRYPMELKTFKRKAFQALAKPP